MQDKDPLVTKRFITTLERICEEYGRTRVNGATASERTFRMQVEVMKQFARTLHGLGLMVEMPHNLGIKHIDAVFDEWVNERQLSVKTLQNQKSRIKQFFKWIDKPQLVEYVGRIEERYADQYPKGWRVQTVAVQSKSWRGSGVDIEALISKALAIDSRYGAMLMLERAFGLRKKEVLLIKPWKADKGTYLDVASEIAKNGRHRTVEIRPGEYGAMQRRLLNFAKSICQKHEFLGWPDLTLKQSETRYYSLAKRVGLTKEHAGMTGHGIRAGHAEDILLLQGVLPSTMGGTKAMTSELQRMAAKYDASRTLGHNRIEVTGAYVGSDTSRPKKDVPLGWALGPPIEWGGDDITVQLWVSEEPRPIEGQEGWFELAPHQAQVAYITAQVLDKEGAEIDRLNVKQLIRKKLELFAGVESRLERIGLTLLDGG